ncbi:MAG: CPBP family intramembrane metalloprotease [Nitrospira sp.]|nr:CPBP family intramembrane metalloprotease [Nitrospira sp.]
MSNFVVSLLFVLAHLVSHSISWSLLVFASSLCFGFVRDRFGSIYPAIALHAFYNTGYFLLVGGASPSQFSLRTSLYDSPRIPDQIRRPGNA